MSYSLYKLVRRMVRDIRICLGFLYEIKIYVFLVIE